MRLIIASLLASFSQISAGAGEDKIGFVYELVRHGARAPILNGEQNFFDVPLEQLTASGMRQRMMFGKYNRQKYTPDLLDSIYNPSQIYVQSTPVLRTLQSGYSQMMGMYPPLDQNNGISIKGHPQLKIRKILRGGDPFTGKFQQVPIYSYLGEKDTQDDLDYGGCPYTGSYDAYHWDNNQTFSDVRSYIMPVLKGPVSQGFNLPLSNFESMSYPDLYNYCDALYSENFQGVKPRYPFSVQQWYHVRACNLLMVQTPMDDKGRTLFITKMLRKPLATLASRVQEILKGVASRDTLRYIIHSAHDFQIAQFLVWIESVSHEYIDVPYSSSIVFELHYDQDCISSGAKDNSCFTVELLSNNIPLRIPTCLDSNQKAVRKSLVCQLDDFMNHIQSVSYQGDVIKGCADKWVPPSSI